MYEKAAQPPASSFWDWLRGHVPDNAVPVSALVKGWGCDYGDCGEAFHAFHQEAEMQGLADLFSHVPVLYTDHAPSTDDIWEQVAAMNAVDKPLLVVEVSAPVLSKPSIYTLTAGFAPTREAADLGVEHKLVSMICYMDELKHYVVFCRRLSDSDCWIFFNDLPGLARGAMRELFGWGTVARECANFSLCPRLLLYESTLVAERAALAVKSQSSCKHI